MGLNYEVVVKDSQSNPNRAAEVAKELIVDDKIREALLSDPRPETIRQLARQAGNRTLQEEGILLMAMGGTSLTEVQRVLKQ